MATRAKKRVRRSFAEEFKAGAVRLVLDEGKTVSQVGRDLDVSQSVVGNWVKQARADRSNGKTGLTTEERGELVKLRREVRELRLQRDILKKSRSLLREGERVKFALIDAEKATCPVATACEALGVSRPGYYAWRRRPESARARDDRRLSVKVRESFELGRTYYGSACREIECDFAGKLT
jgi:transposase